MKNLNKKRREKLDKENFIKGITVYGIGIGAGMLLYRSLLEGGKLGIVIAIIYAFLIFIWNLKGDK